MSPQLISTFRSRSSPPTLSSAASTGEHGLFSTDAKSKIYCLRLQTCNSEESVDPTHADLEDNGMQTGSSSESDEGELPPSTQPRPSRWDVPPYVPLLSPLADNVGECAMEQFICFVYREHMVCNLPSYDFKDLPCSTLDLAARRRHYRQFGVTRERTSPRLSAVRESL